MKLKLREYNKTNLVFVFSYLFISVITGFIFIKTDLINAINLIGFKYTGVSNENIYMSIYIYFYVFISLAIGFVLGDSIGKTRYKIIKKDNTINKKDKWFLLNFTKPINKLLFFTLLILVFSFIIFSIYKIFTLDGKFLDNRSFKYTWFLMVYLFIGAYFGNILGICNTALRRFIKLILYLFIVLLAFTEVSRDFLLVAFPFSFCSIYYSLKSRKLSNIFSILVDIFVNIISLIYISQGRSGVTEIFSSLNFLYDSLLYITGFSFFNIAQIASNIQDHQIMKPEIIWLNFLPIDISRFYNIEPRVLIGPLFDDVRPVPLAIHSYASLKIITPILFILSGFSVSQILKIKNNLIIKVIVYSILLFIIISFFQYYPKQTFRGLHLLVLFNLILFLGQKYRIKIK